MKKAGIGSSSFNENVKIPGEAAQPHLPVGKLYDACKQLVNAMDFH
ncbi:hypothetical protein H7683_21190 [Ectopseudomonas mendocina]|jgi:hypothetical protein|nr:MULTISPECIES: hypothetical protein [Pseudomonas]QTN45460.1 hypothetical protein H7683_21190 [Pseudomonas mendocina]